MLDLDQKDRIERVIANWRLTPATFGHKLSRGDWIAAPHLLHISSIISRAIARGSGRIIISMPPRHGKTELVSYNTSAWTFENFPKKRVILAGYGADLSVEQGRRVRDLYLSEENHDLLRTRVSKSSGKADLWHTTEGGYMLSAGLGGPITGKGADLLLIDDYIKEIKEALSPTTRDYIYNWFRTVAYTRLEPGGTCIIIATRWHTDDLIGRLLKDFPGMWTYIELPAIANANDPLDRIEGTALFPQRYPLDGAGGLYEIKETMGSVFFNALYQQTPVDESKRLADKTWIRYAENLPEERDLKYVRFWDFAATEDGGDWTVGGLCAWSRMTNNFYICDIKRKQISPGQIETLVKETAEEDGKEVPVRIEEEGGSAGKAIITHYTNNVLPGYNVSGAPVSGQSKKIIRAQPFLAAAEAAHVHLLRRAWNGDFVAEFEDYPGLHDDQIDMAAGAYTALTGRKAFTTSWGRKKTDDGSNRKNSQSIRAASMSLSRGSRSGNRARAGSVAWGRR